MRAASLMLFAAAVAGLAGEAARAQLPVAPAPRPIRPDGTRDPAPAPETPAKAEDPAVVVERIIKNSKDVGDRLEKKDAGTDTRGTQDKILKDIDALINRQENPPPPKPDQNKDKDKEKDKDKDKNKDPMMMDPMMKDMPPPMMGDMPKDKMGMGMGKDGMPMGGMNDPPPMPMGGPMRKPRMDQPMDDGKKEPGDPKPDPKGGTDKKPADPKDTKGQPGANAGNPDGKGGKPAGSLPVNDDVAKEVWGHLPDKLRQQMTQYYKEDVMPKYAELLKLYYSSLSEKGQPRK
jgi:hypothetical protein